MEYIHIMQFYSVKGELLKTMDRSQICWMKQTRPKQEKRSTDCMVPFILNSKKCQLLHSYRK